MLEQCLAKAVNAAERRAKVMGDGVRKGFELLVSGFELDGAFHDAAVEFVVGLWRSASRASMWPSISLKDWMSMPISSRLLEGVARS